MSLRSRKASSFSLVAYHHADFCLPDGYVRPHLLIKPPGAKRPKYLFVTEMEVGSPLWDALCSDSARGGLQLRGRRPRIVWDGIGCKRDGWRRPSLKTPSSRSCPTAPRHGSPVFASVAFSGFLILLATATRVGNRSA
jgi:hypothetical protein